MTVLASIASISSRLRGETAILFAPAWRMAYNLEGQSPSAYEVEKSGISAH